MKTEHADATPMHTRDAAWFAEELRRIDERLSVLQQLSRESTSLQARSQELVRHSRSLHQRNRVLQRRAAGQVDRMPPLEHDPEDERGSAERVSEAEG